jgi:SAM-dependent methyltransferase
LTEVGRLPIFRHGLGLECQIVAPKSVIESEKSTAMEPLIADPHACDLCGESLFEPIAYRDRRGGLLETVVCARCGLVQHAHVPSEAELADFYARDYRRAYHGEISPSPRRVMRAWRKGELLLGRLSRHLGRGDRLLEIGSGIGCTVQVFELAGYDAQGVEPNHGFCEYGVRKLHARVRKGFLFDVAPEAQFDVVLLVHVIEHLGSPRRALEHIYQLLRPGGQLYLECPNFAAPFAKVERLLHFGHIYNFTSTTLETLARRAGFELVTQFATPEDPNLRFLLRKAGDLSRTIPSDAYSQTMAVLQRGSVARYHIRASYLQMRLSMLRRYAEEFLFARSFVRRRIELCAKKAQHRMLSSCSDTAAHPVAA